MENSLQTSWKPREYLEGIFRDQSFTNKVVGN